MGQLRWSIVAAIAVYTRDLDRQSHSQPRLADVVDANIVANVSARRLLRQEISKFVARPG